MGNTFCSVRRGALWLALALTTSACDDDSNAGPPGPSLGDDDDSGSPAPTDSGAPDADAALDASADAEAPSNDAGEPMDGCRETAPRFRDAFRPDGRGFDLAVDGLDIYLAYAEATCTGPAGAALGHRVRYVKFDSAGSVSTPDAILIAPADACAKVRDVTLTLLPSGDRLVPRVHFLSTRDGGWALYALRPDLATPTLEPIEESQTEFVKTLLTGTATAAGTALVAYAEERGPGDHALLLHGSAGLKAGPSGLSGLNALALGEFTGENASPVPVLGYGSAAGITLQPVNERGESVGEPTTREVALGAAPVLDFEPGPEGGALVYTEDEELRFLALDTAGTPVGSARKLTFGNERISGASVASFVTGFAIAFRVVIPDRPERALVRFAFTDSLGNLAGFRDLLETSAAGGPLVLKTTVDGRLVVAFAEVDQDGAFALNVARATCTSSD